MLCAVAVAAAAVVAVQMDKLKAALDAALATANTEKALLTGKLRETEEALQARVARVQELEQQVGPTGGRGGPQCSGVWVWGWFVDWGISL